MDISSLIEENPLLEDIKEEKEIVWINPDLRDFSGASLEDTLSMKDVEEAQARLLRFAPFIMKCFPETRDRNGIIESVLTEIKSMKALLNEKYDSRLSGRLLLKQDSHLAIAGSVKARGGIYEVLKHTEDLALKSGMLKAEDNYEILASDRFRDFFKQYTIQVGSTGNLGLSIGIMSAAVGFQVVVHMSADAKKWKKDLLRSHGVTVVEYDSDYSEAVKNGRRLSDENPMSYFVDDENSKNLFLGYAVAAKRLIGQLEEMGITVDEEHPLFVYIPCGVGGAPGGITFGLRQVFGDHVHCFFMEPTKAPCMALGMISGLNSDISVQDMGLSGLTHADGLAVGRASGFVGKVIRRHLAGEFTMEDGKLYDFMRDLLSSEDIFLEPSACASFMGPVKALRSEAFLTYLKDKGLTDKMEDAIHIAWATGGSLVPEEIREEYKKTYLE